MQPESRLLAARENQPQSCGQPRSKQAQQCQGLARTELMQIVNDQDEGLAQRIEAGE